VILGCGGGGIRGGCFFEGPAADYVVNDYAVGTVFAVFVADNTHAVGAEAAAPS
jgi:hypothetical protein